MVEKAWRLEVSTTTIQNCWRHTGILSNLIEREIEEVRHVREIDEVASLLHQLTLLSIDTKESEAMNANEYINYELEFDLNNPYKPTDEDILDMISSNHQDNDVDEVVIMEEVVGVRAVESALETVKKYLVQRPNNVLQHIRNIEALQKEVLSSRIEESRQTTIDSFFQLA